MGDGTSFFSFLSRRRFLSLGLGAGAAAVGLGGGLVALRGRAPSVSGLRVLDAHQYRTLTALARVHLPSGGAFEVGADSRDLAGAFDAYLADEPLENIRDLGRALFLFELGPLLFDHRLATFSNLSPEAQLEHWRAWITSDRALQRQVAIAFKKFLNLVFFDHESVWPSIGYPGPSLMNPMP